MAEYIDREAAIKAIYDSDPNGIRRTLGFNVGQIEEALRAIPAADVAPVRHGKWELFDECYNAGVYCSVCHKAVFAENALYKNVPLKSKFCPNCGARMDGAE